MKISQYADDSNFLLKEQESVQNVIKYFENLQKAAGTTINLEKKIFTNIYRPNFLHKTELNKYYHITNTSIYRNIRYKFF